MKKTAQIALTMQLLIPCFNWRQTGCLLLEKNKLNLFILFVFLFLNSKGNNIDTLYLNLKCKKQYCENLKIKIFTVNNQLVKEIGVCENSNTIRIPLLEGYYNAFIESMDCLPISLQRIKTGNWYIINDFYRDPVIVDTIIGKTYMKVVLSHYGEKTRPNLSFSDNEEIITDNWINWESPLQLDWDYFTISDTLSSADTKSEIVCDLYIEINKPTKFSWNSIKSRFRSIIVTNKIPNNLYIDKNYFKVFAYINTDLSKIKNSGMTDEELFYNRVIFNIYELSARKLRCYFETNNSKNIYIHRRKILLHSKDYCNNLVNQFKIETKFGKDVKKLHQWHIMIYNQLKKLEEYRNEIIYLTL